MDIPLTNEQVMSALNATNDNIIKYADLSDYSGLSEVLKDNDFIIILVESEKNSGHWVSLYRNYSNQYTYFNSYGLKYDSDLNFVSRMANKILGNERNTIKTLMENDNAEIEWNRIKYQGNKSQVCGRYCVDFIRRMREGLSLKQYQTFLKQNKQGSYDNTIIELTRDVM